MFGWIFMIGLVVIGIILLVMEIAVIPGFGICGILGALAMILAFGWALYKAIFLKAFSITLALFFILTSLIAGIIIVIIAFHFLPKTKFGKAFVLDKSEESDLGYVGSDEDFERYLGEEGVTVTPLRPSGFARIKDTRISVVSSGEFLAENVKVKVIKVDGSRIIVEKIAEEDDSNA